MRRKKDPLDRRSVLVQRTVSGAAFLRDLKKISAEAGKETNRVPTAAPRSRIAVGPVCGRNISQSRSGGSSGDPIIPDPASRPAEHDQFNAPRIGLGIQATIAGLVQQCFAEPLVPEQPSHALPRSGA